MVKLQTLDTSANHTSIDLLWIENIIGLELEIAASIDTCNKTQRRSLQLIEKLQQAFPDRVKDGIYEKLCATTNSPRRSTSVHSVNVMLPLLRTTLHSIRVRLERSLKEKELLSTLHSSPRQRRLSSQLRQSIAVRHLYEKMKFYQTELEQHLSERQKVEALVVALTNKIQAHYMQSNDDEPSVTSVECETSVVDECEEEEEEEEEKNAEAEIVAKKIEEENDLKNNLASLSMLEERRMEIEVETQYIEKSIAQIKKKLANEYGSAQSVKQHESHCVDPMWMSPRKQSTYEHSPRRRKRTQKCSTPKIAPLGSLKSCAIQTCSSLSGWRDDIGTQTIGTAINCATYSTQTQTMASFTRNRKRLRKGQRQMVIRNKSKEKLMATYRDIKKKESEIETSPEQNTKEEKKLANTDPLFASEILWKRRDLELPSAWNDIRMSAEQKHKNVEIHAEQTLKDLCRPCIQRLFLVRWDFNVDGFQHNIEMQYTNDPADAPSICLNRRQISFSHSLNTFRRIRDGQFWRIVMRVHQTNVCVRYVDEKYMLFIHGVPFEKIKQQMLQQKWSVQ